MAKKTLYVLALALFLSGCSSLPDTLKTEDQNLVADYQAWINAPQDELSTVRLGGVIAEVKNEAKRTRIEVVNLPIGKTGKPDINVEPEGRFVAYIDGFVDPVTYSEGRLVTILGNSDGYELGKVGDYEYRFPVMKASGYHLWQIKEKVIVHDQPISTFLAALYIAERFVLGQQQVRLFSR